MWKCLTCRYEEKLGKNEGCYHFNTNIECMLNAHDKCWVCVVFILLVTFSFDAAKGGSCGGCLHYIAQMLVYRTLRDI